MLPGGLPVDPAAKVRSVDMDTGTVLPPGVLCRLEVRSALAFDAKVACTYMAVKRTPGT